jgi:hypothetical protein
MIRVMDVRAQCAEALAAYAEAGAGAGTGTGTILVWPLRDARAQLELLAPSEGLFHRCPQFAACARR